MTSNLPWLSLSIFVPIIAGILVLIFGRDERAEYTRKMALMGAIVSFLVTLPIIAGFDSTTAEMQFVEKAAWIDAFNVAYHLGVDGISVWFVILTAFVTVIVVVAGWEVITTRVAQYMAAFFNPFWVNGWGICGIRWFAFLCIL